MEKPEDFFPRLFTVLLVIIGFILSVSLIYYYIHQNFMGGSSCSCSIPVYWVLASLSTVGILVGVFVYYYLFQSFMRREDVILSDVRHTLRFLKNGERKVMEFIIDKGGEALQSDVVEGTELNKVKVSRTLSRLEKKGAVRREENGMTKKVEMEERFKELFL